MVEVELCPGLGVRGVSPLDCLSASVVMVLWSETVNPTTSESSPITRSPHPLHAADLVVLLVFPVMKKGLCSFLGFAVPIVKKFEKV